MTYKNQNSSLDYSTLKDAVLALSYPAVGARTVTDLIAKNYEKLFQRVQELLNIPVDQLVKDLKTAWEDVWKDLLIFENKFENYFDEQAPFQLNEVILTGSASEGLFLFSTEPAADMDFMCVLKNITFSQKDQEDGSLLLRDNTPFVQAFATSKKTKDLWSDYLKIADKDGRHRLSSRKLKEKLKENYRKTGQLFHTFNKEELEEVTEGAALTISKSKSVIPSLERIMEIVNEFSRNPIKEPGEFFVLLCIKMIHAVLDKLLPSSDIVLAISCIGWPTCSKEWITRERLWPDKHQVEEIAESGFHIVPKSSADGDFRLSFSCAETMLIKTLSPLQHRIMKAFKTVIKYHQSISSPSRGATQKILTSYHLKTIAFWHFEKRSKECWTEQTVVHHLVALLDELAEALRTQTLPMYFMPKFNLFGDADHEDPDVMLEIMTNISQLSHSFSAMSKAVKSTLQKAVIDMDPITKAPYSILEKGTKWPGACFVQRLLFDGNDEMFECSYQF